LAYLGVGVEPRGDVERAAGELPSLPERADDGAPHGAIRFETPRAGEPSGRVRERALPEGKGGVRPRDRVFAFEPAREALLVARFPLPLLLAGAERDDGGRRQRLVPVGPREEPVGRKVADAVARAEKCDAEGRSRRAIGLDGQARGEDFGGVATE